MRGESHPASASKRMPEDEMPNVKGGGGDRGEGSLYVNERKKGPSEGCVHQTRPCSLIADEGDGVNR